MPASKSPLANITPVTDKAKQFAKILRESDESIDFDAVGVDALKLILAHIRGDITLADADLSLCRSLSNKYTPDSPKAIQVEHTISPEEYIQDAMAHNVGAYERLQEKAKEYAILEDEKTLALLASESKDD